MSVVHAALGAKPQDERPPIATEDRRDGPNEAALLALVDVTRRRLASIDKQRAPSAADRFAHYLIEGVYAVIFAVTVTVWTVLGFLVWVPLIVRNTIFLGGTVFYVTLFRDQVKVAEARNQVHFAARFYARGFDHFRAFYRQRREPEAPIGLFEPLSTMTRDDLLVEGLWVVSVWSAALFVVRTATSALLG